jgi:hypothetical protein
MASTRLANTMGTPTLGTKFTFSCWVKRAGLGAESTMTNIWKDSNNAIHLRFDLQDNLSFYVYNSGSFPLELETNAVFRDVSAWFHIVAKVDTTQATSSNRCKLYVNGTEQTSLSTATYPSQDATFNANASGSTNYVGGRGDSTGYFDGLMTHVHFTDGYAYDASTFGETDSTSGIWKPKTGSITYGTNGFFLKFENSGNLDLDSSGNSRSFTTSGTITQNIDSPSNNFATMNPVDRSGNPNPPTFANGNLSVDSVATNQNASARSTLAVSTGKWYVEAKQVGTASPEYMRIGILGADSSTYISTNNDIGHHATGYAYKSTGVKANSGTETSYGNSYTNGDIIGIAFDATNGTIWFSKNGTWQNSATITEIQNGTTTNSAFSSISMTRYFMFASSMAGASSGLKYEWNFGQGFFGTTAVASANADGAGLGAFEYSVPSGYYSLCTKNIKDYG